MLTVPIGESIVSFMDATKTQSLSAEATEFARHIATQVNTIATQVALGKITPEQGVSKLESQGVPGATEFLTLGLCAIEIEHFDECTLGAA